MISFTRKTLTKIGVDKTIAFTLISKIIQAGGGIAALVFVARFLTKAEQGYYYTFGSILAIQIFFELGLCNIIIQFVAHENATLIWRNSTTFEGPTKAISRLSSLLRFTIKWFAVISILFIVGLLITGYIFFSKFGNVNDSVEWKGPWLLLAITTALALFAAPIMAYLEGLGKMKEVAKVRFMQQIIQLPLMLTLFSFGFKLYSAPIAYIIALSVIPIWVFSGKQKQILKNIWNKIDVYKVDYRKEIFPFQWKIALSWISGFFIFQLFNPVLFATEGAVVAGQMGMTITVLNAILMLTLSWVSTKVPTFSVLIARREYLELDKIFDTALIQSTILNILGLCVFFFLVFILRHYQISINGKQFGDRFLDYRSILFMAIPITLNHIIAGWATYLRCHKKEPMLIQSIVIAIMCSASTFIFGYAFGLNGITSGYLAISFVSFGWTYFIYKTNKRKWHAE